MKLVERTVTSFVHELASDSPAPGGGSVAALAGSLAAGLASMVAGLTVGREKFKDQEAVMAPVITDGQKLADEFLDLIDRDTASFNDLMAAFKLPKGTDEEKAARSAAIQTATKGTVVVPLRTCEACLEAAKLAHVAVANGNPNAVTDGGSAAQMAMAGAVSAAYNVRVNLLGLKDQAYVETTRAKVAEILSAVKTEVTAVEALLEKALS